ncbi:MAG TPA: P-loop NTPase, partial [Thermoleophilia bacterium]|nr:P-loop NTPase [Thermoleophilia bacterium]
MATIGDLMAGPEMQEQAAATLEELGFDPGAEFTVVAAQQEGSSAGGGSASVASNVVVVTGDSSDPRLAAGAANAYMNAFIEWDRQQARDQIELAIPAIEAALAKYQTKESKLTADYVMLRQRLQDLQILKETSTGNYRVLRPAAVPSAPYAPNPLRSAILGFGVGLFAGIGLAFLLEQFDTRLRRTEDVAAILRQPVLGRIPHISKALLSEDPVVAHAHPEGPPAEAFRLLRTNIEYMRSVDSFKSLMVTSSVQGEGKSMCVANLAVTLAMGGKKVIIVDADLRRPHQHHLFGLENQQGVSTVATGQTALDDALRKVCLDAPAAGAGDVDFEAWARGSGSLSRIYVLTSGPLPPNPGEIVSSKHFGAMLEALTEEADVVIVDSPAMLAVGDAPALAPMVDALLFLVDLRAARRPMLQQAADQLVRLPCRTLGLVLHVDKAQSGYYSYGYYASPDGSGQKRGRRAEGAAKV